MTTKKAKATNPAKAPKRVLSVAMSNALNNQIDAKLGVLSATEGYEATNAKLAAIMDSTYPHWVDYAGNKGPDKCNQSVTEYAANKAVREAMIAEYKARGLDDTQIKSLFQDIKRYSINYTGSAPRHPEVKARHDAQKAKEKKAAAKGKPGSEDAPAFTPLAIAAFVAASPVNAREAMVQTIAGLDTLLNAAGSKKVAASKLAILERASKCIQNACEAMAEYNK